MSEDTDTNGKSNLSVSVPIGGLATLVVLGLATAGYLLASRNSDDDAPAEKSKPSGRNVRRRLGLMTAITLIENDATRKVVVAMLRAMARRA
jgi:hypothetical protein